MMLHCVIIDDEPLAADLLQSYIEKTPELRLLQSFNDAPAAAAYIGSNAVDLIFLDVEMPHMNGIQLLESLPKPPMVIFTTAYSEYAAQGFELDAIDYLLKPFDLTRFQRAVNKALDYHRYLQKEAETATPYIFVKSEYQVIKINLDEIRYIEALDDYIKIYTTAGRPILTLMTLKAMAERLPEDKFARVHRSFIVSLTKIESVRNRKVRIGDAEIPVGNSYVESFSRVLEKRGV
ncbi:MAG: response regulator transcription factor [Bacteroidetes bacterium]|nr:response regulator transcription factor [Bacteroidota bacterium]